MPKDCIIEIGTEELPPLSLQKLSHSFEETVCTFLNDLKISFGKSVSFSTPRRLGLYLSDLDEQGAEQSLQKFGPYLSAAYQDGKPTKAAEGFARSCGVALDALETIDAEKGQRLFFAEKKPGVKTKEILPEAIERALDKLPVAKKMRWASNTFSFVRPLHWIMVVFGEENITGDIKGISISNKTYGHRFMSDSKPFAVEPNTYVSQLKSAYVIVEFDKRRALIHEQLIEQANTIGGEVDLNQQLLDEVTGLVEWPVVLIGKFSEAFLSVPTEALVSAMTKHQKCFPIFDSKKNLMPYFCIVSNLKSRAPETVIAGNERVMSARLSDAKFFYESDQKTSFASRVNTLKYIVYQKKLGTLYQKVERVAALSKLIAKEIKANVEVVEQAAMLCKNDLTTDIVGEFPELQGVMGYYYAKQEGTDEATASIIQEHYYPKHASDNLPTTLEAASVAIAERVDNLVGIFAIGLSPTGDKDPYGLRRNALGLLRILIERNLPLDIAWLIEKSQQQFESRLAESSDGDAVLAFVLERLRYFNQEQGYDSQVIQSVMATKTTKPTEFQRKLAAVVQFEKLEEAERLAAANKRVANILTKQKQSLVNISDIDPSLLQEPAECELAKAIAAKQEEVLPFFQAGQYTEGLVALAELSRPVDEFFDNVLVMTDDEAVRANRLLLLAHLKALFSEVADISFLSRQA